MADDNSVNSKYFRRKRILREDERNMRNENDISYYPVDSHNDINFDSKVNFASNPSTLSDYGASTSDELAMSTRPGSMGAGPKTSTPLSIYTAPSGGQKQSTLKLRPTVENLSNNFSSPDPHSQTHSTSNPSTLDYGSNTYSSTNSTRIQNTANIHRSYILTNIASNLENTARISSRIMRPPTNSGQINYGNSEQTRLLIFIALFSLNLLGLTGLLLAWNVKGISNQNATWALLAVCGMAAFSIFCCFFYFFVCFNNENSSNNNRSASIRRLCCVSSPQPTQDQSKPRKFFENAPFSLAILKNGFGKRSAKVYGVQTVFPTPEFQYFSNSPLPTVTNPETIRPQLNRIMSSSKDSQLSGAAFSVVSTAPASSMLNIADSPRHVENNNHASNKNNWLADTSTDSFYLTNENFANNRSNNITGLQPVSVFGNNSRSATETQSNTATITESSQRIGQNSSSNYTEFRPGESSPTNILELLRADATYSSDDFQSTQLPVTTYGENHDHATQFQLSVQINNSPLAANSLPSPFEPNCYDNSFPFANTLTVLEDSGENDEEIDFELVPASFQKGYCSNDNSEKITGTNNYANVIRESSNLADNSMSIIPTVNMYSSGM